MNFLINEIDRFKMTCEILFDWTSQRTIVYKVDYHKFQILKIELAYFNPYAPNLHKMWSHKNKPGWYDRNGNYYPVLPETSYSDCQKEIENSLNYQKKRIDNLINR